MVPYWYYHLKGNHETTPGYGPGVSHLCPNHFWQAYNPRPFFCFFWQRCSQTRPKKEAPLNAENPGIFWFLLQNHMREPCVHFFCNMFVWCDVICDNYRGWSSSLAYTKITNIVERMCGCGICIYKYWIYIYVYILYIYKIYIDKNEIWHI